MDNKQNFGNFPSLLDLNDKQQNDDETKANANDSSSKKDFNKKIKKVEDFSTKVVNKGFDATYNTVLKIKSKLKNNYLSKKTS